MNDDLPPALKSYLKKWFETVPRNNTLRIQEKKDLIAYCNSVIADPRFPEAAKAVNRETIRHAEHILIDLLEEKKVIDATIKKYQELL